MVKSNVAIVGPRVRFSARAVSFVAIAIDVFLLGVDVVDNILILCDHDALVSTIMLFVTHHFCPSCGDKKRGAIFVE